MQGRPEEKLRKTREACAGVRESHFSSRGLLRQVGRLLERIEEDLLEIECDIRDSRRDI